MPISCLDYCSIAKRAFLKRSLPLQVIFFVTSKCNLSCKHCYNSTYNETPENELKTEEIEKIARNIQSPLLSVSFSGGEPFLREDLFEISSLFLKYCRPIFIQFSSNGYYTDKIISVIKDLAKLAKGSNIVLNISLDGLSDVHDRIRGVIGSFLKATETIKELKSLQNSFSNISVFTATTCMEENQNHLDDLFAFIISNLKPDNLGLNLAWGGDGKEMLGKVDIDKYTKFCESKKRYLLTRKLNLKQRFILAKEELESDLVRRIYFEKKSINQCYGAHLLAIIKETGLVYSCLMKDKLLGDLRSKDIDYDLSSIWRSEEAEMVRKRIKREKCHCFYSPRMTTSILFDPKNYIRLARLMLNRNK